MRRLLALPLSLAADVTYSASQWLDTAYLMVNGQGQQGVVR